MTTGPKPIPFITEDPHHPSHFIIDPAAATLLKNIKGPICPVVVAGPYRSGKCFARGTRLRLYDGDTIAVENVRAGMQLIGDDSLPRTVTAGTLTYYNPRQRAEGQPEEPLYRITPNWSGAEPFTVNGAHILVLVNNMKPSVKHHGDTGKWRVNEFEVHTDNQLIRQSRGCFDTQALAQAECNRLLAGWQPVQWEVSVSDYLRASHDVRKNCMLFASEAITFHNPALPPLHVQLTLAQDGVVPTAAQVNWMAWWLGIWLTDGMDDRAWISQGGEDPPLPHHHREIFHRLKKDYAHVFDDDVEQAFDKVSTAGWTAWLFKYEADTVPHRVLRLYGLLNNKHVPRAIICDSIDVRRRFLAGLIDGDGYYAQDNNKNVYEIACKHSQVLAGYKELAATLGFRNSAIHVHDTYINQQTGDPEIDPVTRVPYRSHRITLSGHMWDAVQYCAATHKRCSQPGTVGYVEKPGDTRYYGFQITKLRTAEYFGFAVHGGVNQRFLLEDYTVTHNSTLLNLLLPPSAATTSAASSSRRAGFAVGSSIQACTKGIWLWGEPIKADNKTILFLDSEGLSSIGKEQTFDVKIFSLSILLASLFLLNTTGTINESALEQLELVVQMTERVRAKDSRTAGSGSSSGGASASQEDELHALAAHFPDFLWVLRDFSLQLEDAHGSPISARQYLEQALQPVAGARSAEKNRIRHVLSTVFPSRDCVPLVRPITDEKQLQRMATLDAKDLRSEFRAQMDTLRERVRAQVRPKTVEGVTVTGSAYLSLADAYVRAINGGTVPVIHSAWTAVVELQAKKAMDDARASFHADLKQASASLHSSTELATMLEAATIKAHQLLSETAVGNLEHVEQLRKQLNEWIRDEAERVRELNVQKSREHNERVWTDVWKRAKGDSVVEEADEETAWSELEARVRSEYSKQAKGEGREEVLTARLAERRGRMIERVMRRRAEERRQLIKLQRDVEAKDKRVSELERQVAKLEMELENERRTRSDEKRRGEEVEKRAEDDKRRLERQLSELKEQLKEALEEGKGRRKELNENQSRIAALESDLRRLREEAQAAEARVKRAEGGSKERQVEADSLRSEVSREKKEASTLREQYKQSQEELDRLRSEVSRKEKESTVLRDRSRLDGEELQQEKEKRRQLEAELRRVRDDEIPQLEEKTRQAAHLKEERRDALDRQRQAEERAAKLEQELQDERALRDEIRARQDRLAEQEQARGKKRRLENRDEQSNGDVDMPDTDHHHPPPASPPSSSSAFPPPAARPSMAASRRSLATSRVSLDGASSMSADVDPNELTIQQLKSRLTELDVELPMKPLKKDEYVEMLYGALPELNDTFPRKVAAKKAKKGR